jgi:hypothetical protein
VKVIPKLKTDCAIVSKASNEQWRRPEVDLTLRLWWGKNIEDSTSRASGLRRYQSSLGLCWCLGVFLVTVAKKKNGRQPPKREKMSKCGSWVAVNYSFICCCKPGHQVRRYWTNTARRSKAKTDRKESEILHADTKLHILCAYI